MLRSSRAAAMSGDRGAAIAERRGRDVETADHGLERVDRLSGIAQRADQSRGDEGLANIGAGGGDEVCCHVNIRSRTTRASRAISLSG
jgi:hypothetical protein